MGEWKGKAGPLGHCWAAAPAWNAWSYPSLCETQTSMWIRWCWSTSSYLQLNKKTEFSILRWCEYLVKNKTKAVHWKLLMFNNVAKMNHRHQKLSYIPVSPFRKCSTKVYFLHSDNKNYNISKNWCKKSSKLEAPRWLSS